MSFTAFLFTKHWQNTLDSLRISRWSHERPPHDAKKACADHLFRYVQKFSFFISFLFIMNLASGHWDHARLIIWDAQSQNQEKLGWGLPQFCRQGGLKIGKSPKTAKNLVINSVFNSSHLLINLVPGHWDQARLVVWNAQIPNQKKFGEDPLLLPLGGSENWKIPTKHEIFKIIVES